MGNLSTWLVPLLRRVFLAQGLMFAATVPGWAATVSAEVRADLSADALALAVTKAVGSEPLSILARGKGVLRVETSEAGFDYLLSEAALTEVKRLSPEAAAAAAPKLARYKVALTLVGGRLADGASVAEADGLKVAAAYLGRSSAPPSAAAFEAAGHATLLVRGLDASGSEISRQVVADPRVVRGEAVSADGALNGRVDFIRGNAVLEADLADDPRIATLAISAPDQGELARVSIR